MSSVILQPFIPDKNTKMTTIPGSKSDTNRALVIASLAKGVSVLQGISESDDSLVLMQALEKLGVRFEQTGDQIKVTGLDGHFQPFYGELTCGIAGTTGRFLAALCALIPGDFVLTGEGKMLERPMSELFQALQTMGVKLQFLGKKGCLPVRYENDLSFLSEYKNQLTLSGGVSSQFFTALLLIAPCLPKGLQIQVLGEQVSKSYIDMTQAILQDFGVKMLNKNYQEYLVQPDEKYQAKTYQIDGDASGCSYFWALAAVTGQKIRVNNINPNSVQGDVRFVAILEKMGCHVVSNLAEKWVEVEGPKDLADLHGVSVDMENMPDTAQTLAVVAAFAQGKTKITGLSTLKAKETNRLQAVKNELAKMGIGVEIGADWMEITGGQPKTAKIETYHDHRMAMSFAVASGQLRGMTIDNSQVVSKSFPDFWQKLTELGMGVKFEI